MKTLEYTEPILKAITPDGKDWYRSLFKCNDKEMMDWDSECKIACENGGSGGHDDYCLSDFNAVSGKE